MASSAASTASRSRITRGLLALALSASCQGGRRADDPGAAPALPYYATAAFTAEWGAGAAARHRVGAFSLRDQDGRVVSGDTLRGKIYVANFFFSSCGGICPKMLTNLRRVQDAFAADDRVALVSHTVMPSVDSQATLSAYARRNGVRSGKWHLLTGDREAIYELARTSYFAEKGLGTRRSTQEFLHTENLLLVDARGRIRGVYNATLPLEVDRAIEDIRQLLREEAAGRGAGI